MKEAAITINCDKLGLVSVCDGWIGEAISVIRKVAFDLIPRNNSHWYRIITFGISHRLSVCVYVFFYFVVRTTPVAVVTIFFCFIVPVYVSVREWERGRKRGRERHTQIKNSAYVIIYGVCCVLENEDEWEKILRYLCDVMIAVFFPSSFIHLLGCFAN